MVLPAHDSPKGEDGSRGAPYYSKGFLGIRSAVAIAYSSSASPQRLYFFRSPTILRANNIRKGLHIVGVREREMRGIK
jgi:hypothetical protein